MKKTIIILALLCALCATAFAQNTIYVSAKGDDKNDGFSESKAVRSLSTALDKASDQSIKTIMVIGTISIEDNPRDLFNILMRGTLVYINKPIEITITGKPNATGSERAVLSGNGVKKGGIVGITSGAKVRFEHIEISGGADNTGSFKGFGIIVQNGSLTLGTGAVVRDNEDMGILIADSTCIIDGGEVRNNRYKGIWVADNGVVTMRNGIIRDNSREGILVAKNGTFTMSGGTITANSFSGVRVDANGRFDQTGGTINGNTDSSGKDSNISRANGSLGKNL